MAVLVALAVLGAIAVIIVAVVLTKEKHPFGRALASAVCGLGALGAVNLFASYTGVAIALNYFTALTSIVLSVPGVIMLLILRILFVVQ